MKVWIVVVVASSSILSIAASPLANAIENSLGTHDLSVLEKDSQSIGNEFESQIETTKHTQLHFQGEFCHDHVFTVPKTEISTGRLFSFFQNKDHRNLLLKGGGNPTIDIPRTPELLAEWATQSRIVSSTPPILLQALNNDGDDIDDDHALVAIHSTVPVVPGLSIQAISYMGCRLLPHPQTKLPMYEFTLIQDQYQALGTKPLVWIYRKITGETPTTNTKTSSTTLDNHPLLVPTSTTSTGSCTTKGLCRVALERAGDETWRLSYYSMVNLSCTLPQKLLKLLPLTKQKFEAKISATMVKQLEREILQSADKFHFALEAWLKRQHAN